MKALLFQQLKMFQLPVDQKTIVALEPVAAHKQGQRLHPGVPRMEQPFQRDIGILGILHPV